MTKFSADTWIGLSLVVLAIIVLIFSLDIPLDQDGSIGARVFPMLCAVALIIIGLLQTRMGMKTVVENMQTQGGVLPIRPILLLVLSFFYLWLMSKTGYIVSTSIVAPLALMLFDVRNRWGLIAAAILAPIIYHLIFFELLGVYPPYGSSFDLLDFLKS